MLDPKFVLIGVAINFILGIGYLIDTLKGETKPNKVSWLLWSIAPLIAFAAEIKQGVGILSLSTFIVGFTPLLIFFASFVNKKSQWKLGKLDIICGLLSVVGLILWQITKVGNIAILFSVIADALAAAPTVVKSYYEPESESANVYIGAIFNSGIALLTITIWTFQNYAFPAYIFLIDVILVMLIQFKLGKKIQKTFP